MDDPAVFLPNTFQKEIRLEPQTQESLEPQTIMWLYRAAMEAVMEYTGLTPMAFFTILTMMVVVYKTVCGMFVGPEDFRPKPKVEPPQLGDVTEEELQAYNGSDPRKPLLIAIRGQIYDVSSGRIFYGPGGPYAMFAGREASRALAMLSFKGEDINGNLEGLSEDELQILEDWEFKFKEKYPVVGRIVPPRNEVSEVAGNQKED